ncbi:hypothetical protein ASG89_22860 [Paenibacillus sp. Soil766]|nr:hypothetical protein ASG89_22860 [Paenibacillus sp. Soil766]
MNAHEIKFYTEKQEQQLPELFLNQCGHWFEFIQHHTFAFYAYIHRRFLFREVVPLRFCSS